MNRCIDLPYSEMLQQFFEKFKPTRTSSSQLNDDNNGIVNPSVPIFVNVYDMFWMNEYTTNIGLGVYHSGVEVHGREYCFGGHPFEMSGIFCMQPKDCEELGENYQLKASLEVGRTEFTSEEVNLIIQTLGEEFRGDQYHLLNKNCNNFSEAFVQILCGTSIPKWVNRLASLSSRIPFIERAIPKEWISPLVLPDEALVMSAVDGATISSCTEAPEHRPGLSTSSSASASGHEPGMLHHWLQFTPAPATPSTSGRNK